MADYDYMYNSHNRIVQFMCDEIQKLLNMYTNELQFPNWDQALNLFVDLIVNSTSTFAIYEEIHQLGKEILNKAEVNYNKQEFNYYDKHQELILLKIKELKNWLNKNNKYLI